MPGWTEHRGEYKVERANYDPANIRTFFGLCGFLPCDADLRESGSIEKPLASLREASRRTDTGDKIAGASG